VELKKNKRIYAMKVVKKELVNDDEVQDMKCYSQIYMSDFVGPMSFDAILEIIFTILCTIFPNNTLS